MTSPARNLRSSLSGFGSRIRGGVSVIRSNRRIIELEDALSRPGGSWTAAFERTRDTVSLALFGVTEKDTRPDEPRLETRLSGLPAGSIVLADIRREHDAAMDLWEEWQRTMAAFEADIATRGAISVFASLGIDVSDDRGGPVRCIQFIQRQMFVASRELLPSARLTFDGSGHRAAQSAEDWGAALAAEAAKFRSRR